MHASTFLERDHILFFLLYEYRREMLNGCRLSQLYGQDCPLPTHLGRDKLGGMIGVDESKMHWFPSKEVWNIGVMVRGSALSSTRCGDLSYVCTGVAAIKAPRLACSHMLQCQSFSSCLSSPFDKRGVMNNVGIFGLRLLP